TYSNSCVAQTTAGVVSWTPGECGGEFIPGCTVLNACNFNPIATTDDGSCFFPGDPCDDGDPMTGFDMLSSECVCVGMSYGCTEPDACNFDPMALLEDGSCILIGDACDDNDFSTDNDMVGADCVCAGDPNGQTPGCMAVEACNYNAAASIDDGSCLFVGSACDDGHTETQNDFVNADCVCLGDIIGCTALSACNYNPNATLGDFSCVFPGDPCDDGNADTFNDVYGFDCTCMGEEVFVPGCTEPNACNYNMSATTDDGSCLFIGEPCDDGDPSTILDVITVDCICQGQILNVLGCTVPEACNYLPEATIDDGSCFFVGDPCDDGNENTTDDTYNANCDCEGAVSVEELQTAISVYPNPSSTEVSVTVNGLAPSEVHIFDATGRFVLSTQRTSRIDIHTLAPGVYTFRVMHDGGVWEQQMIKD
ncbi:MAG: T9SS type A sorting domain-containing protein, partial [Flavobacteriales bacterium]